MKRASRFLTIAILSVFVFSAAVSASTAPDGTMLPDNVTGYGTTDPTSLLDDILPDTGSTVTTDITPTAGIGGAAATEISPSASGSAQTVTEPSASAKQTNELTTNYALSSNGASYQKVRLSADNSAEEEISEYFGGTDDAENKRLNDGEFGDTESAAKSVAIGGSGRTFRFKFDLGQKKNGIEKIVFKNIQDSYSADPLNNRSFDDNKFKVSIGDSASDVKSVNFTLTKTLLGDNGFSYDVSLDLKETAEGRYVYIEAGPVENAFVLSIDEIQIFGREQTTSGTSESEASATDIKTPATGDNGTTVYTLAAIVSVLVISSLILYRKKSSIE